MTWCELLAIPAGGIAVCAAIVAYVGIISGIAKVFDAFEWVWERLPELELVGVCK